MIQVSNAGTVCLRGAVHRLGQRRDGGLPQLCSREGGASDPDEMDGACGHGTHEVSAENQNLGRWPTASAAAEMKAQKNEGRRTSQERQPSALQQHRHRDFEIKWQKANHQMRDNNNVPNIAYPAVPCKRKLMDGPALFAMLMVCGGSF